MKVGCPQLASEMCIGHVGEHCLDLGLSCISSSSSAITSVAVRALRLVFASEMEVTLTTRIETRVAVASV